MNEVLTARVSLDDWEVISNNTLLTRSVVYEALSAYFSYLSEGISTKRLSVKVQGTTLTLSAKKYDWILLTDSILTLIELEKS